MEAPTSSSEIRAITPQSEIVGVPKWFMTLTMTTVLGMGVAGIGFIWRSSLAAAVTADRQGRIEDKLVSIERALEKAAEKAERAQSDRWTSNQDQAQDAKLESRITRELDRQDARQSKVESRLDRVEAALRGDPKRD